MTSSLAAHYGGASCDPPPSVFEPAQASFDQALKTFKENITRRPKKGEKITDATTLEDVLSAVTAAQASHKDEQARGKTRKCITAFSQRICHYSKVMDVLVQYHPEYTALAWGAMKLVFGAIVEHENLGRTIVTGLCDVADALPRVEMAVYLYPTNAMKEAVALLYAHILEFLVRAWEWYQESKIARAIHTVTRPVALRYKDVLDDIGRTSRRISELAITSSQTEQRDVHRELQDLTILVKQLKEDIKSNTITNDYFLLDLRHSLHDIQLTQAITFISSACSIDHKSSLQTSLLIRDRHRFLSNRSKCLPFWNSSELNAWNTDQRSSFITIQARFKSRFHIRNFCTNVIQQLRDTHIAVFWVLKPREQTCYSVIEVLKSLLNQALVLDPAFRIQSLSPFQLRQFLDAHSEQDYLNLLENVLQNLKLVYVLVEVGAMSPASAFQCGKHLQELSKRLSGWHPPTIMKTMFLGCGPNSQYSQDEESNLLRIGQMSRRTGKKLPTKPLSIRADSVR